MKLSYLKTRKLFRGEGFRTSRGILISNVKSFDRINWPRKYGYRIKFLESDKEDLVVNSLKELKNQYKAHSKIFVEENMMVSSLLNVVFAFNINGIVIATVSRGELQESFKIGLDIGIRPFMIYKIIYALNMPPDSYQKLFNLMLSLYKFYNTYDCLKIKVSIDFEKMILISNSEIEIDRNAAFRQKIIKIKNIKIKKLMGNIGCIFGDYGSALLSIDAMKEINLNPGSLFILNNASPLSRVLDVLNMDEKLDVIFINIFNGTIDLDEFATIIVDVATKLDIRKKIIVRMQGWKGNAVKKVLQGHSKIIGENDFIKAISLIKASL